MPGDVLSLSNDYLAVLTATVNGAADGSTAVASNAGQVDDFYLGDTLRIIAAVAQTYVNEEREITGYNSATGTFIVDPPFTSQIVLGDVFAVLRARPILAGASGPLVAVSGIADAGSTAGILRDAARTEANDYWNGALLIMTSGVNIGIGRMIEDFLAATDDIVLMADFPAVIAAGDRYIIVSFSHLSPPANDTATELFEQVIGRKTDTLSLVVGTTFSLVAYVKGIIALLGGGGGVVTDGSVGPSNFFAAPVAVLSISPADVSYLDAYYLDCNAFTNGAILTADILIRIGAGDLQRQIQKQFVKGASNTLFAIIDSPTALKGVATSIVVNVQSSNALDIAVTTPFSYLLR